MIVVGFLGGVDGLAVEIARRAAVSSAVMTSPFRSGIAATIEPGVRVEMVGAAGLGSDGDRQLVELAAAGVGHATVIRTGADTLDAGDLDLALRYLPDIRCVVLVRPPARLLATAVADTDWAGAALVLVGPLEPDALGAIDASAASPIVLDPPTSTSAAEVDEAFASFVAALANRLESGDPPEKAFRATVATLAVDSA